MVGREVLPVSLLRQSGRLLNFDARFWENNIPLSPIYFASQVFSILLYRGVYLSFRAQAYYLSMLINIRHQL